MSSLYQAFSTIVDATVGTARTSSPFWASYQHEGLDGLVLISEKGKGIRHRYFLLILNKIGQMEAMRKELLLLDFGGSWRSSCTFW